MMHVQTPTPIRQGMSTDVDLLCKARDACIKLLERRGVAHSFYADCEEHLRGTATLRRYARLRAAFVKENLGLVHLIAYRSFGNYAYRFGHDDLVQEGVAGLLRAIDLFRPEESKFSTYATYWIRKKIHRALENKLRLIRLPSYQVLRISKLRKKRDRTDAEEEELQHLLRFSNTVPLLQRLPVGHDHDRSIAVRQLRQLVADSLEMLPERLQIILSLRFGLSDGVEHSLEVIGEQLGVSGERVRQLEARALQQLREHLEKKGIE